MIKYRTINIYDGIEESPEMVAIGHIVEGALGRGKIVEIQGPFGVLVDLEDKTENPIVFEHINNITFIDHQKGN